MSRKPPTVSEALACLRRTSTKTDSNESQKAQGVQLARPKALTSDQLLMAQSLKAAGKHSAREIADQFGVNGATLYRSLSG